MTDIIKLKSDDKDLDFHSITKDLMDKLQDTMQYSNFTTKNRVMIIAFDKAIYKSGASKGLTFLLERNKSGSILKLTSFGGPDYKDLKDGKFSGKVDQAMQVIQKYNFK